MVTSVDWMEKNHVALFNQATKTWVFISDPANRDRMGLEGTGHWLDEIFEPKYTAFINAVEDWRNEEERTKLKTVALEDSQEAFTPVYRQLYSGFLKSNPLVTNLDLTAMGLPERNSGGNTPAPIPTTQIETEIDLSVIRRILFHFHDSGSERKAKPVGVHGAEIRWSILPTAPHSIKELLNSSFDTHTPFMLEFDEEERGLSIYFCLRWENTRGDKGPWGEIGHAIIP